MFTKWDLTDSDCNQYIRSDGNNYEMIQSVWMDTTIEDEANGLYEYCIVKIEISLDDYTDEEKEMYIATYGYTLESVLNEYENDSDLIIAECIMEEECLSDAYVISEADTFEEAKAKIDAIVKGGEN